jgi:hypothetical protein
MVAGDQRQRHQGRRVEVPLSLSAQNGTAECALQAVRVVLIGTADCARATPNDTAVAAAISDNASASVAINSTPTVRFLDNDFSKLGEAKPTCPVSALMVVSSFANQFAVLSEYRAGLRRSR